MADDDLKIWQNNLLPNPFYMVDAKFDLVLRPISHGNPAMPFVEQFGKNFIALYLHCFLMKLEFFFLNQSSFHTLSMYVIKSYEN